MEVAPVREEVLMLAPLLLPALSAEVAVGGRKARESRAGEAGVQVRVSTSPLAGATGSVSTAWAVL